MISGSGAAFVTREYQSHRRGRKNGGLLARPETVERFAAVPLVLHRRVDLIADTVVKRKILMDLPTVLRIEVIFVRALHLMATARLDIRIRNAKQEIRSRIACAVEPAAGESKRAVVFERKRIGNRKAFTRESEF